MNYLAMGGVSGACCCLQLCCKELSQAVFKIIGRIAFVRFMYLVVVFGFMGLCYLAMYFLRHWGFFMSYLANGIDCENLMGEFDCISQSIIYRIMFTVASFFVIILLMVSVCTARISIILNQGLFFSKFIILVAMFIGVLQIPDAVMEYFATFSQFLSYLFIAYQIIVIIDLLYIWGIKWANKYSEGSQCHKYLLIFFTILNYSATIFMIIFGLIFFSEISCIRWPIFVDIVLIVLMLGIQLLNYNKQNSLIATSGVSIYCTYWLLAAVYSDNTCNQYVVHHYGEEGRSLFLVINIAVSIMFVVITSFGSIYGASINTSDQSDSNFIQLEQASQMKSKKSQNKDYNEQQHKQKVTWIKWHLLMLVMSLYMNMILTDWGSGDIINGRFNLNFGSIASKIVMGIGACTVYIWTLIAPRIFQGRNFYFQ